MTDTPNEFAPATRSEWLALIREAVRLEMAGQVKPFVRPLDPRKAVSILAPQPPTEG